MAESKDNGFEGWPDSWIEGYWEIVDFQEKINIGLAEYIEQCRELKQECETELFKRWREK